MALSIESFITDKKTDQEVAYSQFVGLLADMVEKYLSHKTVVVVRKPRIDAERWLRRQLRLEEAREMDKELTASLLGTGNFVQIA